MVFPNENTLTIEHTESDSYRRLGVNYTIRGEGGYLNRQTVGDAGSILPLSFNVYVRACVCSVCEHVHVCVSVCACVCGVLRCLCLEMSASACACVRERVRVCTCVRALYVCVH